MKLVGLVLTLLVSIGGGLFYWNSRSWDAQSLPESYKVLEDLEKKGIHHAPIQFKSLEGQSVSLESFKGKIVILSFWATWCEPCVEEFPSFIKLLDEFPEKVVLVAISHDEKEEDVKDFVSAFNGYRKNLILALDKNKSLSKSFKVDRLPEGFVFDGDGKLLKKIIGIQDWASEGAIEFFKAI